MNFAKPLIMASLMAVTATGASAAKFTPELLNSLGRVSDAQVSPDGKKVLYGVSTPNIENNNSNRELWVMDIDGKTPCKSPTQRRARPMRCGSTAARKSLSPTPTTRA